MPTIKIVKHKLLFWKIKKLIINLDTNYSIVGNKIGSNLVLPIDDWIIKDVLEQMNNFTPMMNLTADRNSVLDYLLGYNVRHINIEKIKLISVKFWISQKNTNMIPIDVDVNCYFINGKFVLEDSRVSIRQGKLKELGI